MRVIRPLLRSSGLYSPAALAESAELTPQTAGAVLRYLRDPSSRPKGFRRATWEKIGECIHVNMEEQYPGYHRRRRRPPAPNRAFGITSTKPSHRRLDRIEQALGVPLPTSLLAKPFSSGDLKSHNRHDLFRIGRTLRTLAEQLLADGLYPDSYRHFRTAAELFLLGPKPYYEWGFDSLLKAYRSAEYTAHTPSLLTARDWMTRLLKEGKPIPNVHRSLYLRNGAVAFTDYGNLYDAAEDFSRKALQFLTPEPHPAIETMLSSEIGKQRAHTQRRLGQIMGLQRQPKGFSLIRESLDYFTGIDDRDGMAAAQLSQATVLVLTQKYSQARQYVEGLESGQDTALGPHYTRAATQALVGGILFHHKQWPEAAFHLHKAYDAMKASRISPSLGRDAQPSVFLDPAECLSRMGDPEAEAEPLPQRGRLPLERAGFWCS